MTEQDELLRASSHRSRRVRPISDQAKRLRFAELLLGISRKMAGKATLDEVLEALIEATTSELNCERGTIFLNDPMTSELVSRVAQGTFAREIRVLNNTGIAGTVFSTGEGLIIDDAYADSRFNKSVDQETQFETRNLLCAPTRTALGDVIGVTQMLNKRDGAFTPEDMELLCAMTTQGSLAIQSAQSFERMKAIREQELEFMRVVTEISSELKINALLSKVIDEATRMLNADRGTLFLHDEKRHELWSEVGQGLNASQIRIPDHAGIAGSVFQTNRTINIPYAYADLRFNPSVDRQTGYFTRSILCVPVINQHGKTIGVTQMLNKRGGPFTQDDESRLKAFTAQISIALENAKLFDDVATMKNYNESMLESMSSGVLTLDVSGNIATCNAAGLKILRVRVSEIINRSATDFFGGPNAWVIDKLKRVEETGAMELMMDAEMQCRNETRSVNVTVMPLNSVQKKRLGWMIMIDDISSEKRMKSTMSRYIDPSIADQLLSTGADILGGKSVPATVLFSDIRSFTTLTEQLGAQGTVSLLNEYFEIMVECVQKEGGMLDKFIGDAMMAAFGIPVAHDDDEDRSARAAIAMIRNLDEWNRSRVSEGKMAIEIGIGLNTDIVVSGNIGSKKRMDFTLIGDGVNLASRLESACKQYKARILLSEFTFRKLRGTYRAREVDRIVVKGKTEPVGVYEMLEYHTDETFPNIMEVLGLFKHGLAQYRAGKWDGAIASFTGATALNPGDALSKLYIERCEQLKASPPAGAWDGVWVMTEK
jgi:adenylate cyclase